MLIDYYGLKKSYNYPGGDESQSIADRNMRMELLEQGMKLSLEESAE